MASVRFIAGKGYRVEWSLTIRAGPDAGKKIRGSQLIRSPQRSAAQERLAREVAGRRSAEAARVVYGLERPRVAWQKFLADYRRAKAGHRSIDAAVATLRRLAEHSRLSSTADFTAAAVQGYAEHLRDQGRSDCSLRHTLGHISAAMSWCFKRRLVEENPFASGEITLPAKPEARERFITRDDLARLARRCRAMPEAGASGRDRRHALRFLWHVFFLVNSGLRIEEYCTATQRDFHGDRLTIYGKGREGRKKRRTVPLNRRALQAVRQLPRGADGLLFDACHPKVWPRKYARWFGRIGRPEIRPHDLRRTFGSWLAMAGVALTSIASLMGHSSIETTCRHYAHLTPEYLAASVSNMRYHTRLHRVRASAPGRPLPSPRAVSDVR